MTAFPKDVEVILARHLASCLAMAIFLVDPDGNLVFYNESAEAILGCRFEETGDLPADEWAVMFDPTDGNGVPLAPAHLPLIIAITDQRPAHRDFWIVGQTGVRRHLDVTAVPLIGQADRFLGALAIFWEVAS